MKTRFLILFFSLLAFDFSWGQTLEWARQFGGETTDMSQSVKTDSYNNVYITGSFTGTCEFNNENSINFTSYGSRDILVCKYSSTGNLIWGKQIGGTQYDHATALIVDAEGNIYITGVFNGTCDFDPGNGICNLTTSSSYSDIFICKLDSNGNFIWAKKMGATSQDDYSYSITLTPTNEIVTTGYFKGTADFDPGTAIYNLTSQGGSDIFISKLDSSGNFIWAKGLGEVNNETGLSVTIDSSGNTIITGRFTGTMDFNPSQTETENLTSFGNNDIFVLKLSTAGNFIFAKQMGGIGDDIGYSVCLSHDEGIYITGKFNYTADFDPSPSIYNLTALGSNSDIFICRLDSTGNFIWAKRMGCQNVEDIGTSIIADGANSVYTTGTFYSTVDFDPSPTSSYLLTAFSGNDVFLNKLDSYGNFIFTKQFGASASNSITIDNCNNIFLTGSFTETSDFDPNSGVYNFSTNYYGDSYLVKLNQKGIIGNVYHDINGNCNRDSLEIGIKNRLITINSGTYTAQTNEAGTWVFDSLPTGTYTATIDTSGNWLATCPVTQTFTIGNTNEITYVADFGLVSTQPCANPDISIDMPSSRRCSSNQKNFVSACNQYIATGVLYSAYADIELDSLIILQSANLAYTSLGNNTYRFQVGNLNPGQCVNFTINCNVSCDAMIGQTLCMQANLYPADSCVFDTIPNPFSGDFTPCTLPWDKSSLSVEGYCQNDTIYFVIYNTGAPLEGDMDCWSPVRIYVDGVYTTLDSVQLAGGDSIVYAFPGDGRTWRLEADQHPLHPGNSHPNATVEACGDLNNWTPDLVNILPQNDADPIVDIYCGVVTGSYDPNDKNGYPTGLAFNHYIMPNQQLQYVIRFQNTGTDTAFTVVIRDTLDMDLDIFSVVPGVASHNYNFQMYGPRVLEWTFYNIQLPDSNHSEPDSHGFCTFTVNQNHDLPNNTKITNSADIYFDYNAPITTNQTMHTINDQVQTAVVTKVIAQGNKVSEVLVYPNPATNEVFIETSNFKPQTSNFKLFSIDGKKVLEGKLESSKTRISTKDLESGVYFIEANVGNEKINNKLVITR